MITHGKEICFCGHEENLHNGGDHCHGEQCTCKIYEHECKSVEIGLNMYQCSCGLKSRMVPNGPDDFSWEVVED